MRRIHSVMSLGLVGCMACISAGCGASGSHGGDGDWLGGTSDGGASSADSASSAGPGSGGQTGGGPAGGQGGSGDASGPGAPPRGTFPAGADPANDGPFGVYTEDATLPGATKKSTLYVPSNDGGKTPVTTGKYPLVVALPGYQASYTTYEHFTKHIVTWGHVVLGIDFEDGTDHTKNAIQVQQAIDWALTKSSQVAIVDPDKIATAGHSKGGKIALYASTGDDNPDYPEIHFKGDPRIGIVLGWDPIDAGGPPCAIAGGSTPADHFKPGNCLGYSLIPNIAATKAKLMLLDGLTGDPEGFTCQPKGHTASTLFADANTTAELLHFADAGHLAWVPAGLLSALGGLVCGASGSADNDRVIHITKRANVAWLLKHFGNLDGLDPFLTGAPVLADCADPKSVCTPTVK